jgi:hypothetical protein
VVVGGDCQSVKRRCVRIHICFHLFKLLFLASYPFMFSYGVFLFMTLMMGVLYTEVGCLFWLWTGVYMDG